MNLNHPKVNDYLESLNTSNDALLQELEQRARATNFPIIGPVAGRFCYQIATLLKARRIYELGSGYGYSTLWFARAVSENGGGEVYHTVWDENLSADAKTYIERAGLTEIVRFHVSEAVAAFSDAKGLFDIVFNDIDKDAYPASLPLIKSKLRPGGAVIIDNMLWGGRIFDANDRSDDTRGVREATKILFSDPDFVTSLIPIRDGLILAVKREAAG